MGGQLHLSLSNVSINNFKSYKKVDISLERFNVIIGPNDSGKTNFLEFFKFLRKFLQSVERPYVPYVDWWSCRNLVFGGNEKLELGGELRLKLDEREVIYKVSFSVRGGTPKIQTEVIHIDGILSIEREKQTIEIKHDPKFIKKHHNVIKVELKRLRDAQKLRGAHTHFRMHGPNLKLTLKSLRKNSLDVPLGLPSLLFCPYGSSFSVEEHISVGIFSFGDYREPEKLISMPMITPNIVKTHEKEKDYRPFFMDFCSNLKSCIDRSVFLRHPDIKKIRDPLFLKRETELNEDSSNLQNVLYNLYYKNKKLPKRIERAVSTLFPGMEIRFQETPDGRVFMKVYKGNFETHPPGIPDGLYKVLTILVAIESKPFLLAIDEIENSLHASALEYVIDELKNSDSVVILTSHSPVVVDMVKLEDLLIAEKKEDTTLKRIDDPDKLRKRMRELGITHSESWLYGKLT